MARGLFDRLRNPSRDTGRASPDSLSKLEGQRKGKFAVGSGSESNVRGIAEQTGNVDPLAGARRRRAKAAKNIQKEARKRKVFRAFDRLRIRKIDKKSGKFR